MTAASSGASPSSTGRSAGAARAGPPSWCTGAIRGARAVLEIGPDRVFLAVGLVAGLLFLLLTPPFRGSDEAAHFSRAYQVSEGTVLAHRLHGQVGGTLPRSLAEIVRGAAGRPMPPPREAPDGRVFVDFRNTAVYTPVAYLPQALAMAVTRALGLQPLGLLYASRAAGMATALILGALAIRTTPIAKRLFMLLALAPMSVRQMSLLTADSVTNGCAFLLTAVILRLALDPAGRLERGRLLGLAGLFLVVVLSKQAYVPFLGLYLVLPVARLGSRRRYVAVLLAIAGLSTVALAWWVWASRALHVPQAIAPSADIARQIAVIARGPIEYAGVFLADLASNGVRYLRAFVGLVPDPLVWSHLAVLGVVALLDGDRRLSPGLRARVLFLAVAASSVVLVNTFAYLAWNPVGADVIRFVQGRYYIPIGPLSFLLLFNRRLAPARAPVWLTAGLGGFAAFVVAWAVFM